MRFKTMWAVFDENDVVLAMFDDRKTAQRFAELKALPTISNVREVHVTIQEV